MSLLKIWAFIAIGLCMPLINGCAGSSGSGGSTGGPVPVVPPVVVPPATPQAQVFDYGGLYQSTIIQKPSPDPGSVVGFCTLADDFAPKNQYFQFNVLTETDANGAKTVTVSFISPSPLLTVYGPTSYTDQASLANAIGNNLFTYTFDAPGGHFNQYYALAVGKDIAAGIKGFKPTK